MQAQIIKQILILRPVLLATIAISLLFFLIALLCVRKVRVKGDGNWLASMFVGLSGRSLLHMAVALVKFSFYCALLLMRTSLMPTAWMLLGALTLITLLLKINLSMLFSELVGGGLQAAGLMVCTYLQDYMKLIRHTTSIEAAYWLLSAVLAVSALMVFIREITVISAERNYFDESGDFE